MNIVIKRRELLKASHDLIPKMNEQQLSILAKAFIIIFDEVLKNEEKESESK